jgi:pantothenate kinase type III
MLIGLLCIIPSITFDFVDVNATYLGGAISPRVLLLFKC